MTNKSNGSSRSGGQFESRCPYCGEEIEYERGLCEDCERECIQDLFDEDPEFADFVQRVAEHSTGKRLDRELDALTTPRLPN